MTATNTSQLRETPSGLRLPRATWLILAIGLYAVLHALGAVQVVVDSLPGRQLASKLYHVIFYGGFAAMVWLSMKRPSAKFAVFLTMCAGIADEWHQTFSAFRHPLVSDVVLDTVAGAVAIGILVQVRRRKEQQLTTCTPVLL
jgi:VanZ family protein